MKKTLGFILLIISILMFSSCSVKMNTPEVPKAFTQNAVVTSGDFSYECEICKKEGSVSITVKNTNALGLVMTYDGKKVSFKYSTYSYDISGENFEKENAAIIIYDVISALSNDDTKLHIIDGGVKYYTLEDQILRIDIPAGVNGFKYNRIYYFNNGVLYFGLVYSAANQNSLYFYQGEMYRYINEKGEMKQNEFKDDVFKTLGNFALNEAYSFYDYKTGVKNDRR